MRQPASLTAGGRDASSTGDLRAVGELLAVAKLFERTLVYEIGKSDRERAALAMMRAELLAQVRAAIALSDHQNAPTDDATGQRSGLSP